LRGAGGFGKTTLAEVVLELSAGEPELAGEQPYALGIGDIRVHVGELRVPHLTQ
jgi:hypothetical protein